MKIIALQEPIKASIDKISSDKSISHRCAIFSLLSDQKSVIKNYLKAGDTLNTLKIIEKLGAIVEYYDDFIVITPPKEIIEPNCVLECGNSGTTMRILMGFLASIDGFFVLSGDKYLNSRPMKRVGAPLSEVGAKIYGRNDGNLAPLCIKGTKLDYFEFNSKIASAQVKTALILAGLNSNGCEISEPELSRDHSEKMLISMGADISINSFSIEVKPLLKPLKPLNINVANDPSSAFYFALIAAIIPNSHIILKNVILNKTRTMAYDVLRQMGVYVKFIKKENSYDDIGDIEIKYSQLNGISVSQNTSWLIDEAPALAIAFACANGKSTLRNAAELRVKECDRIAVMVDGLKTCGINAKELDDGFEIVGGVPNAAIIEPSGDHRIAMSFAILGLKCGMIVEDSECINTSFPSFSQILRDIGVKVED
ncbi:3-phosphoshikimate 1-carboxyvinyltransferase [Campylobacter sp. RM12327]|uniref:3-phosphoshikimate 1-carboxyvinyltransferase n=1 Tax=Campylobacter sputorum TaxID=206 RepID=UPI000B7932E3|nr:MULTISPECIES: 3-phosphoshikimate 1-carboxyvinyltransferase [Campylobacter]ASM39588.1 3-phosphoshikimate 1-carboxyvinyltransferase [Campylobacter sputorum]MBE7358769.1 3-phosphoshikimate 1-carboxyvinyltransferase [Campylobacter sp. RM11302]MBF6670039.1 3-phosphoshikimate 1-carboxyvinyltransferase [Campylobacter sp. RM12327]MBF6675166.1 3-phosphoshikimate 1-carboxyvinyltransferase [Campylobacter sp. RM13538]MBF6676788.1 3-phosphoshikimate 1-carboxyvinyltransferase [Campylobacter sp. RM12321]